MIMRTCITPDGEFRFGVHRPSYTVSNLRKEDHLEVLGSTAAGEAVDNQRNFPKQDVRVDRAAIILEIPNAFPFRGTTYIDSSWADVRAKNPQNIALATPRESSMVRSLENWDGWNNDAGFSEKIAFFSKLPENVLLAVATTSTDPEDLRIIAALSCQLFFDGPVDAPNAVPCGLCHVTSDDGQARPVIHNHDLFEAVVNNPWLPDAYKVAMVLRPGVQGGSEIIGDIRNGPQGRSHIFEYLRRNSYIPWGHYAANMAHLAVRYRIHELDFQDMTGLRHLYYQRTYVRMAEMLGLDVPRRQPLNPGQLEELRISVLSLLSRNAAQGSSPAFNATLWGWNFGFDFALSGYRLHASHQQIHQQYALIPASIPAITVGEGFAAGNPEDTSMFAETFEPYACGDLVADAVACYRAETGHGLFSDYLRAIRANRRTDGRPGEADLVVHEDDQVLLFVPKAQAVGFELQLMPLRLVGNILEADTACRAALDKAILIAHQALERLGVRMVTSIEYSRRLATGDPDQRLLYAFLPKLPYAPGGFSEAQARCIVSHYPEDFAFACRMALAGSK